MLLRSRFANWEEDEQLAAVELGRRLGDDPEAAVAQLKRSSAGCDWLIGRWRLLGNGLSTAEEGGPGCTWTDADLALALDLLGRPRELRHLDEWPGRLESLRAEARSGSDGGRGRAAGDRRRRRSPSWRRGMRRCGRGSRSRGCGLAGGGGDRPGGRGDAAAALRGGGRSAVPLGLEEAGAAAEGARRAADAAVRTRAPPPSPPRGPTRPPCRPPRRLPRPPAPARARARRPGRSSLLGDPAATVLDFWVGGPPRPGISPGIPSQNKTNPTPGQPAGGGRAAGAEASCRSHRGRPPWSLTASGFRGPPCGPCRQHRFIEGRVAVDQHGQADLVEQGGDPGVGLADSEGPAGAVEAEVMGQEHGDRLAGEVMDELEVDHDPARERCSNRLDEPVPERVVDRLTVHLGHLRRDDQDLLDHLAPDPPLGVVLLGERDLLRRERIVGRGTGAPSTAATPRRELPRDLILAAGTTDRVDTTARPGSVAVAGSRPPGADQAISHHRAVGAGEVDQEHAALTPLDRGVLLAHRGGAEPEVAASAPGR